MAEIDTALVVGVGASEGLGAAAARRFAREGLHVVVAGRTAEKVQRVAEEICASGGSAEAAVGDAANETDATRFVETAEAKGPLALVLQILFMVQKEPLYPRLPTAVNYSLVAFYVFSRYRYPMVVLLPPLAAAGVSGSGVAASPPEASPSAQPPSSSARTTVDVARSSRRRTVRSATDGGALHPSTPLPA